jgi:hypothetical protein
LKRLSLCPLEKIAFLQFSRAAFFFSCIFAGFVVCGCFCPNNQAKAETGRLVIVNDL